MPPHGTASVKTHMEVLEQLTKQLVKNTPESHNYAEILDAVPIGIGIFRSRVCMWMNHFGCRIFGYDHCKDIVGLNSVSLYADRAEYERVGKCIYPAGITVAKVKKYDGSEERVIVRITNSDIETGQALVLFYSVEDMTYLCKTLFDCDNLNNTIKLIQETGECS